LNVIVTDREPIHTFLIISKKCKIAAKIRLLEVIRNLHSDRKHVGRILRFSKQQGI